MENASRVNIPLGSASPVCLKRSTSEPRSRELSADLSSLHARSRPSKDILPPRQLVVKSGANLEERAHGLANGLSW
jgi:hypothetical protein